MMKTDVEANFISCNTAIRACAKAHDAAGAVHSLPEMMKADVEANIISYIIVIKASAETPTWPATSTRCLR